MPHIAIISPDSAFSDALCEQIAQELQHKCVVFPSIEAAGDAISDAAAVVSTLPAPALDPTTCLTFLPSDAPYSMRQMMSGLHHALYSKEELAITADCRYLPRSRYLVRGGARCELTDREGALLMALVAAGPEGVAKDYLLKHVWGFEPDINTHTLETHIYRLRQKMREQLELELIYVTPGGGYSLLA